MKKILLCFLLIASSVSLPAQIKVVAFSGSNRAESLNKKLASQAAEVSCAMGADARFIDLNSYCIPLYNNDDEKQNGMPEGIKALRKQIMAADIVLIASPEYNASLTAFLKNTLDWLSRSEEGGRSHAVFENKTFILLSASPGKKGGAKGLIHLKDVLLDIGGSVHGSTLSVGKADSAFDENNKLKEPYLSRLRALLSEVFVSP